MSSIPTEKHYYFSRAFQRGVREPFPTGDDDQLAIHFFLIKQSRCWYDPAPTTTDDINREISIVRSTSIRFPSANPRPYEDIMSLYISSMGVPPEQHPPILEKLYQGTENRVVRGASFETRRARFVPATRSSIGINDRVTWESFETRRLRTVKHNSSCAICMVDFARGGVDQLITPLPCTHYYHLDCIIPWLKTSHVCPMCRYPMPRVEEGEGGGGSSNP
ncbi:hypothetical protein M0R45_033601 [Rubus argutus]|uniref:RING-type E3 ubiquitin transferase n=1 Tax=Rubus argutus TaxID=59490 RepID=A0AAW1WLL7_RUBAR